MTNRQTYFGCLPCRRLLVPGIALLGTATGEPDFPGDTAITMSPGGPGRLVDCLKCPGCGYSMIPPPRYHRMPVMLEVPVEAGRWEIWWEYSPGLRCRTWQQAYSIIQLQNHGTSET